MPMGTRAAVIGLNIVAAVLLGSASARAQEIHGSIVAWGQYEVADLSAVEPFYYPARAPSPNAGFVAIAASRWSSAGLKADGAVVWLAGGWDVVSDTDYVGIALGFLRSFYLKSNGSIETHTDSEAWVTNAGYGCHYNPVVAPPNANFVAIGEKGGHGLAVRRRT